MVELFREYFTDPDIKPDKVQIAVTTVLGAVFGFLWVDSIGWWVLLISVPLMLIIFFSFDASAVYRGYRTGYENGYAKAAKDMELVEHLENATHRLITMGTAPRIEPFNPEEEDIPDEEEPDEQIAHLGEVTQGAE